MERLPDRYFDEIYAATPDPWRFEERWYEQRKYAITLAMLPNPRYRHAFEPGCSVGVLTEQLAIRCERVTSTDVAAAAVATTQERMHRTGASVTVIRSSLDDAWPTADFDLVVLSEVLYYLHRGTLRVVLDRECARLAAGTTIVAAHWRHPVADYPLTGDEANAMVGATAGLTSVAHYRDDDVVIDVLSKGEFDSVATRTGVPGAEASN